MRNYVLLLVFCSLLSVAQLIWKKMINKINTDEISTTTFFYSIFTNLSFYLGAALFGISLFIWFKLLSQFELNKIYPLVSVSYIITLILSILFLSESVTIYKVLGTVLVVAGVIFLTK